MGPKTLVMLVRWSLEGKFQHLQICWCALNFAKHHEVQGTRKPPSAHLGHVDFVLEQVTFSNHLPTGQALTQWNENERYWNFKLLKIIEAGQVEECLGQVGHEGYLADRQDKI